MWNNDKGEFVRYSSKFRNWVKKDGSTPYLPEVGRYHLYISLACPWAHRTYIVRQLRKLDSVIGLSIVDPVWNEYGWWFSDYPGVIPDTVNNQKNLIDIYRLAQPGYDAEESTPVLWDKKLKTIVSNESRDIIRMFSHEFSELGDKFVNLCPPELEKQIDETIDRIYRPINNGVYRAGFATSQSAYERAVEEVFAALDEWDKILEKQRYMCGNKLTEADVCMFTTLLRFDPVYHGHFKCNIKQLREFQNLWSFVRDIYQHPRVAETCNIDHIKRHYYMSHGEINPTRVVPVGPIMNLMEPHGRNRFP